MALRTTHIVVSESLVSGYLLITKQPAPIDIACILGIWLGVQLPDLDNSKTRINRRLGFIGQIISHLFGHRTWTHTIWAIVIMLMLSDWLPVPVNFNSGSGNYIRWLYVAVAIGYFLHVFEDSFSYQGVCWFYPFQHFSYSKSGHRYRKRRWHWFYYRTGGKGEMIVRWLAFVTMLYLFIKLFIQAYLKS